MILRRKRWFRRHWFRESMNMTRRLVISIIPLGILMRIIRTTNTDGIILM